MYRGSWRYLRGSEKAVEGNREGSEGCGGSVGCEGINRAEERQGEEGAFN